jgi:2-oxo-4-hydroxy-4-carboxy--5-ureidoimidazoline (OHCU) decarboxylase
LITRARALLDAMSEVDRIAVINAHPRIGERPGRVKAQSTLSYREQGYVGDTTPPAVMAELARLNAEYERRFGFRFVVFVNRRSKADLVPVLRARLEGPRAGELATALEEILAIAADRARQPGDSQQG